MSEAATKIVDQYTQMELSKLQQFVSDYSKDVEGFRFYSDSRKELEKKARSLDAYMERMSQTPEGRAKLRDEGWVMPEPEGQKQEEAKPEFEIQTIGSVHLGVDGRDEYVLLKCKTDDVTPEIAREYFASRVFRESSHPGGYFCNTVRTQMKENSSNECICIIEHRYDV